MTTDPMTAPDLDELARLLEEANIPGPYPIERDDLGMYWAIDYDDGNERLCELLTRPEAEYLAALLNAAPALLATARRERRYRGVLAELRDGEWGPASYKARAALAEEGQDVE